MSEAVQTYDALRHFADSWALLAMVAMFLGIVAWAFRPGGARHYDAVAQVPFKHEVPVKHEVPIKHERQAAGGGD